MTLNVSPAARRNQQPQQEVCGLGRIMHGLALTVFSEVWIRVYVPVEEEPEVTGNQEGAFRNSTRRTSKSLKEENLEAPRSIEGEEEFSLLVFLTPPLHYRLQK